MLHEAIAHYHGLLDDGSARENHAALTEGLRREGLFFGDRPLCVVLRPHMLEPQHYAHLQDVCRTVATASRRVVEKALAVPRWRDLLALTPAEDAFLAIDPGYREPSACSRLDSFYDPEASSLQFVEYNAETPAGMAYEDVLTEVFFGLPVVQEFSRRYELEALPNAPRMLCTLLAAHQEWGGGKEPRIAIVDWDGVPTRYEFELFVKYFKSQGVESLICTPDQLQYRDRTLYAAGKPVTLVYKRVLISEFLERYGGMAALEHPLGRAYRDGRICMVDSFRCKPMHKKAIFALLSDPEVLDAAGIDRADREVLFRHVPWTRRVVECRTAYQGQEVDLLSFARDNRERLLLKPNDEYGGKGVVIGWESSPADWAAALDAARQTPFVVQERVHIAYEDYPDFLSGRLQLGRRLVDLDPYLFGTEAHGAMTRLSSQTLLNVTHGGGSVVPTLLVRERTAATRGGG